MHLKVKRSTTALKGCKSRFLISSCYVGDLFLSIVAGKILLYLEVLCRAIWTACCGCGSPTTTSRRCSPRAAASQSDPFVVTSLSRPPLPPPPRPSPLVSIRPNLPLPPLQLLPLLALRWPQGWGLERGREGPGARRGEAVAMEKGMARSGGRGAGAPPRVAARRARRWVWACGWAACGSSKPGQRK